jgi:hypothetical protein
MEKTRIWQYSFAQIALKYWNSELIPWLGKKMETGIFNEIF